MKTKFRETIQQGNGEMELGGRSIRVTSETQLEGTLEEGDRDVKVEVGYIDLAADKLYNSQVDQCGRAAGVTNWTTIKGAFEMR